VWVYVVEGPGVFTVGFFEPKPPFAFVPESTHNNAARAAARVHYLMGGTLHAMASLD